MRDYFIQNLYINKVRHHSDINIPLSQEKRKHLIITGRNGSGKTSLMEEIANNLSIFEKHTYESLKQWEASLKYHLEIKENIQNELENMQFSDDQKKSNLVRLKKNNDSIQIFEKAIQVYNEKVTVTLEYDDQIDEEYKKGKFIIAYFNANRTANMITPKGVEKIELQNQVGLKDNLGSVFVKYLVDLKTQELFARHENENEIADKIERWFHYLEENFKLIFESQNLELKYDYKNYNFLIIEPEKEPYSLNSLSSGFSSVLNIVTELIMRMENNKEDFFDVPGIVLIDEIEAHLHVSLQKKVFKFLTDMFPHIQFIITTHSPFVITSIEEVIIYDLESRTLVEDLSNYSYTAILEEFFKVDQYSYIAKSKLKDYKVLSENISKLTPDEFNEMEKLHEELSKVPNQFSEELKLQKMYIDLKTTLRGMTND